MECPHIILTSYLTLSPELEAVGSGLVSSTNIGIERALHNFLSSAAITPLALKWLLTARHINRTAAAAATARARSPFCYSVYVF